MPPPHFPRLAGSTVATRSRRSRKTFYFVAASALAFSAVPAGASTVVYNGDTYNGDIYTWVGSASSYFYCGGFARNEVDSGETTLSYAEFGGTDSTFATATSDTFPSVKSLFCTLADDWATLRFVAAGTSFEAGSTTYTVAGATEIQVDFSPFKLGGLIVESGATGYSIAATYGTNGNRVFRLGQSNATSTFSIGEDFSIYTGSGGFVLNGASTYAIAEGKTLTLSATTSTSATTPVATTVNSGTATITGGGTLAVDRLAVEFEAGVCISNGTLSASDTATIAGTLSIESAGTLSVAGLTTLSSAVSNAGTMSLSGGLTATDTLTNSGTLNLLGGTVTLSSALENTGTVTVASDVVFDLSNLSATDSVYTVISGAGTLSGWDELSYLNFVVEGSALTSARQVVSVSAGAVTIDLTATEASLVWAGTQGSDWAGSGNWTNSGTDGSDSFYSGDLVTFDATASATTVTLSGSAIAGAVVVDGASYTFDLSSGGTLSSDSLTLSNSASLKISGGTVAIASGGLEFSSDSSISMENVVYDAPFRHLTSGGNVSISNSSVNGWLYLGKSTSAVYEGKIEFSGSISATQYTVYAQDFTATGASITATSGQIYLNSATGTAKFAGTETALSGRSISLVTTSGSLSFEGKTTLASTTSVSVTVSDGGSATFAGETVMSNSGSSTAMTLSVSRAGGTIEFKDALTISSSANIQLTSTGSGSNISFGGETALEAAKNVNVTVKTGGAITFSALATLTATGAISLSKTTSGTISFLAGAVFNAGSTIKNTADLSLSGEISFAGTTTTLTNTGTVTLSSATVASALTLSGGSVILSGENVFCGATEIATGTTLSAEGGSVLALSDGATLSLGSGVELATASVSIVLNDAYLTSEADAVAALSGEGSLASGTAISLSFSSNTALAASVAEELTSFSYRILSETLAGTVGENVSVSLASEWADAWELSYDSATGVATLTAISVPEPSAFGLLAGTLALALAVARRRRRA